MKVEALYPALIGQPDGMPDLTIGRSGYKALRAAQISAGEHVVIDLKAVGPDGSERTIARFRPVLTNVF